MSIKKRIKQMAITLSVILSLVSLLSTSVNASNDDENNVTNIQNNIRNYSNSRLETTSFQSAGISEKAANEIDMVFYDEQFQYICKNDPDKAKSIIDGIISQTVNDNMDNNRCSSEDEVEPSDFELYSYYQGLYYLPRSIPEFAQSKTYYCGPAATIMAQIGNGKISNTSASYNSTSQFAMANQLGTTLEGTYVYNVAVYLHNNAHTSYGYEYIGDVYNDNTNTINDSGYDLLDKLKQSISANYVPVLYSVYYDYFSYYNGYNSGSSHYLVVTQIDEIHDTVTVLDPHYSSLYNGYHELSYSNFISGMDHGYVIYC